ncbi:MAG: hypothetical protein ACOYKJ_04255 [Candidatus Howiella sp.]|jgi:hypothetical protein
MRNHEQKKKSTGNGSGNSRQTGAPLNDFAALQAILRIGPSQSDPDGMYTGKPIGFDLPVQDNDDL